MFFEVENPLAVTFVIGITTIVLLIWYSSIKQSYWKKIGIPYAQTFPVIGSVFQNFVNPLQEVELERYFKFGPIYGHYEGNRPLLSIGDPKLLRDIFVKDFSFFANRRSLAIGDEIFDKSMAILEGEDWRRVRNTVSPSFSTGKLKRVLSIFKDCGRTLGQNFKTASQKGEPINAKKLYGALAMDVIASSAFSTKIDSHNDPENKFVKMAKQAFGTGFSWRFALFLFFPRFMKYLGIHVFEPTSGEFFTNLTLQIIKERKRTGQKRNDFLQLLIDTTEEVSKEEKGDNSEKENDFASNYGEEISNQKLFQNTTRKNLSMNEVVAQCNVFFLAGYDTTASTLSFTSYLLATNEDIQEKARHEITDCLKETNGELTYEALQKMKYLDNVISESLRIYPPAIRLERRTETCYKLNGTDIIVPKDMIITIPSYALHRDPKFFPNPEKFDPNRFCPEERAKRDSYAYLPFGAGPRNCIGMRFALLEIKVTLVYVINNFNIKTCKETQIPIQFHSGVSFGLLQPKDIMLRMVPRDQCSLIK